MNLKIFHLNMIVYDSLSINNLCKFCWVEPFAWDIFPAAKFEFGTRKVSPFCTRPKRSHYKAMTSQIAQNTRVLWLTRGFTEEKLLWSDSWAQDCKLQGQDSHNESMCVSFLKRKWIRERSGLIWTVFDSVRIRFDPHYRAASRKNRSTWMSR